MELARLIILLSILALLFMRPRFIRDYFGDTVSIVLGFVAIAATVLQFFLFQKWGI